MNVSQRRGKLRGRPGGGRTWWSSPWGSPQDHVLSRRHGTCSRRRIHGDEIKQTLRGPTTAGLMQPLTACDILCFHGKRLSFSMVLKRESVEICICTRRTVCSQHFSTLLRMMCTRGVVLLCGDVHRLHNVNELLFVGHRPIDLVVVTWAGPGTPQVQINESKTRVQAARPCSWYRRGT